MNTNLSGRAQRLLLVLRTLPDGTTVTNAELADRMGNSERLVMMALTELTDAGSVNVERFAPSNTNRTGRAITVAQGVSA